MADKVKAFETLNKVLIVVLVIGIVNNLFGLGKLAFSSNNLDKTALILLIAMSAFWIAFNLAAIWAILKDKKWIFGVLFAWSLIWFGKSIDSKARIFDSAQPLLSTYNIALIVLNLIILVISIIQFKNFVKKENAPLESSEETQ
jgi:hypothetical protein